MGHVCYIPTMQFFTGISRNTQSKSYTNTMLSLTECVWNFKNDALWDTHQHALLFNHRQSSQTKHHEWNLCKRSEQHIIMII